MLWGELYEARWGPPTALMRRAAKLAGGWPRFYAEKACSERASVRPARARGGGGGVGRHLLTVVLSDFRMLLGWIDPARPFAAPLRPRGLPLELPVPACTTTPCMPTICYPPPPTTTHRHPGRSPAPLSSRRRWRSCRRATPATRRSLWFFASTAQAPSTRVRACHRGGRADDGCHARRPLQSHQPALPGRRRRALTGVAPNVFAIPRRGVCYDDGICGERCDRAGAERPERQGGCCGVGVG